MNLKKSLGAPLLALLVIVPVHPKILTWRANVGQQYETKITLKESVIGLDSISEKPALVTVNALYQEEAARNQSTIPHLKGMPSFPRTSVEPGSSWKADTTILYDLSAFGLKEPLAVTVKVSVENIQFEPDSAVLVEAERNKLSGIGKVLSALGERKLSIVGHAAAVPGSTEEELRELSSARAASVASYLVDSGFRTASSVVSNGVGGSKPLDSNETAEGRRKNRRVEIIILDEENNQ